jgi:hypothetical protein
MSTGSSFFKNHSERVRSSVTRFRNAAWADSLEKSDEFMSGFSGRNAGWIEKVNI